MDDFIFTAAVHRLIDLALEEDIGSGDITTQCLIPSGARSEGAIIAKEPLVLAGLAIAENVFRRLDPGIDFQADASDGDKVAKGDVVVRLEGDLAGMLTAERTALNFLQRLSGIATNVSAYVQVIGERPVRLVDTRKTTPGWRVLEKYAVRMGGGSNHRMGLFDAVLIKDNHIAGCGGIEAAVKRARDRVSHLTKIEVEAATMTEVREAIAAGADVIMLDNMDLKTIVEATRLIDHRALVEISGGVTTDGLQALAESGVDLISVGALTHSARAVDLSMKIKT
jgi:nicotinate-nucleotide pyrophosphorylase (carboxylating)